MNDRWDALVADAESLGYSVELVEYVECADAPGLLGMALGVCIYGTKTIRIKASAPDPCATLAHELEHARAPHAGEQIDREHAEREGRTVWGFRL